MGVLKLHEAATQMATKNGSGFTPNCSEMASPIGKASAAAALLVMISVNTLVMMNTTASSR